MFGLFRAIGKYIRNIFTRGERTIDRAADGVFTGSAAGIRDAYDQAAEELRKDYQVTLDAVSELEMVVEERRIKLEEYNKAEVDVLKKRAGALKSGKAAKASSDTAAMAKHRAAFTRFQTQLQDLESKQAAAEAAIVEQEGRLKTFESKLTAMQAEVERIRAEKPEAVADFVANKKIIELNNRLTNMASTYDRGSLTAVREMNKKLSAKARVSTRLAGTDVTAQDSEYATLGESASADDLFEQMLAEDGSDDENAIDEAVRPDLSA